MLKKHTLVMTLFFVVVLALISVSAFAATLTTITIKEMDGISTAAYPLTFGHVFKQGDVTGNVYLNSYSTQTDVKTTWSDGSIRHAVISALVPMTANSDLVLNINDTGTATSTTPMNKTEILATDIGATINLTGLSDSGYSGDLTANLRTAINNEATLNYWLSGGVVSEILVDQRLNNSLNATWEVRFYPGTSHIRISHVMENVEANYRGNIDYTVAISQDNASPTSIYGPTNITHLKNSRWRKVFWMGSAPSEIEIHYDLDYLISTGHILSYDTSLAVPQSAIDNTTTTWNSRNTDLYGVSNDGGSNYSGLANMYFPNTGGRPEIGVLPRWIARYLLTWDSDLKNIMLRQAELLANTPVHWREFDESKSFVGRIINIDDRPKVRISSEGNATSSSYDPLPVAIGSTSNPWTIDLSHQGSFNYIPYLISGEYFYLQEMYYWAGYNLAQSHPDINIYGGRDKSEGIIAGQIRAVAWALRNIVHAEVMAPDNHIEKTYFADKIQNNITYRTLAADNFPLRYMDDTGGPLDGFVPSVINNTSPWMEDFFTIVMVHTNQLGHDTSSILAENSKFIINRFSHPDFNWYLGAEYRFPTITTGGEVMTWAEASSLYTAQPTEFSAIGYAYSYWHIALATLSQVVDQPNGQAAYDWMLAKWNAASTPTLAEQYANDPTWAIVPMLSLESEFKVLPPRSLKLQ